MIPYVVSKGDGRLLRCMSKLIRLRTFFEVHDPDMWVTLFRIDGGQQKSLRNHVGGVCSVETQ